MDYKLLITQKGENKSIVVCENHLETYLSRIALEGFSTLSVSNECGLTQCCLCEERKCVISQ